MTITGQKKLQKMIYLEVQPTIQPLKTRFHFDDAWSFKRKTFMYSAKQSTHSQVITLFEKFFLMIY